MGRRREGNTMNDMQHSASGDASASSGARLKPEDMRPGVILEGVIPDQCVTVIAAIHADGTWTLVYRAADGSLNEELVDEGMLQRFSIACTERDNPAFDGDSQQFRLASDALRIRYASLYDTMSAVYSSNIDPLPHQIRAVYEDMLPKVPLRFLLADDPGAGKTIMAGLYIKEMIMRSAAERVIIVCPGGLAQQWQDELEEKFNLRFEIFEPSMVAARTNPFTTHDRLIVRMDQVARNDELRTQLNESDVLWDIAVVDEAHRMSAHYKNGYGEVEHTNRFRLGEILSTHAENLLLMTATPHSGKEDDFRLFMSLLDRDRFAGQRHAGKSRPLVIGDMRDVMRRMVKEDLLRFDGRPLFPERHAQTVEYRLSKEEMALYEAVTAYVRTGMNAVSKISEQDGRRGSSIGFALTLLQRRLASSPQAIHASLRRRRDRLERLLRDWRSGDAVPRSGAGCIDPTSMDDVWEETDEADQARIETQIEETISGTTWANNVRELQTEIAMLDGLVAQSEQLVTAGTDAKWLQLSSILSRHILDAGTDGFAHKLIVFTEHRDTLEYLVDRIAAFLGAPESVVCIHGGLSRRERKDVQSRFVNDPSIRILVATDAAGEGLNLQRADLMVNYDLPWNPNRIEQRFGRIHRIGQQRPCFLWNMVAANTREGEVYATLLSKIAVMGKTYDGRLFNVLGDGDAFAGRSLKDLMLEAIRYGDDPCIREKLDRVVNAGVSDGLSALIREQSADRELNGAMNITKIRDMMERNRARKLQPGYIEAFFLDACSALSIPIRRRERGRWEVVHVPHRIRSMSVAGQSLTHAYERITFNPAYTHVSGKPDAELIAAGSPLLDAVVNAIIEQYGPALQHGAVFVDRTDTQPEQPMLIACVEQDIRDDQDRTLSKLFDYVRCEEDAAPELCEAPPYLDYEGLGAAERVPARRLMERAWFQTNHRDAMTNLVTREHGLVARDELATRIKQENAHILRQVRQRLQEEIDHWYGEYNLLLDRQRVQGKTPRMAPSTALQRARDMEQRLELRERELDPERVRITLSPPRLLGMALVVPSRFFPQSSGMRPHVFAHSTEEVDRRAIDATLQAERALGRHPQEMPHNNKGYDIRSTDAQGAVYFIEVKGRITPPDPEAFTVSANEVAFAKTQGDRHRLSLVKVSVDGPERDELRYVGNAFDDLDIAQSTCSFNEHLADYWNRGVNPF